MKVIIEVGFGSVQRYLFVVTMNGVLKTLKQGRVGKYNSQLP